MAHPRMHGTLAMAASFRASALGCGCACGRGTCLWQWPAALAAAPPPLASRFLFWQNVRQPTPAAVQGGWWQDTC
eukprot:14875856-Alexandrium_andersonii.AAC.1